MLEVAESWGSWSGDNLKGHSQLIFDVECNVSRLMIKSSNHNTFKKIYNLKITDGKH